MTEQVVSGTHTETVAAIVRFLEGIGIPVRFGTIDGEAFLPGLRIERGGLLVDPERLLYPGDLLHEAGHLAVMTAEERAAADGNVGPDAGAEMAALAWSYAAAVAMGLDPQVVFHEHGYKGNGAQIAYGYAHGQNVGVPLLAWFGLTEDPMFGGVPRAGEWVFPKMKRWLRA
jgi:hypothetical protein